MKFECADRYDQHYRGRFYPGCPAFDIHEFFCAEVRAEPRLRDNIICQFQRGLCRDDGITAVCDIRKRSAVNEERCMFQGLYKIRFQRVHH